jgi:hypothetical protein
MIISFAASINFQMKLEIIFFEARTFEIQKQSLIHPK